MAGQLLREAFEMRKKLLGPKHLDLRESANALGELHTMQSDFRGAINWLTQDVTITETALGSNSSALVEPLCQTELEYIDAREHAKDGAFVQRALKIAESPNSDASLRAKVMCYNMNAVYSRSNRQYQDEEKFFTKGWTIGKLSIGQSQEVSHGMLYTLFVRGLID
jgi:hypothetical protein